MMTVAVRREAGNPRGDRGDPAAVGPLVASLADKSVAPAAAEALAAIGEPAAALRLLPCSMRAAAIPQWRVR